jgi:GDPmannose 4,6-dehydratase
VQRARVAGVHASNLVLFGHTSPLQSPGFVLPAVADQAVLVALGQQDAIVLRDPSLRRDWGSARDFVRAFAAAASGPPGDYVIGTGQLHGLEEIALWALDSAGATQVSVRAGDGSRRADFDGLRADPASAARALHWTPSIPLRREIECMVAVARARRETGIEHDPRYLEDDLA